MPRSETQITIDTKVLDRMIAHTGGNVAEAIAKTALSVEARAKIKAPVDTGALRASIYTSLKSNMGAASRAQSEALARTADVETVQLPTPKDDHTAYVGPSVNYGEWVHNGTTRMAGRPFLLEAVRETERDFRENLGKAVSP